MHPFQLWRLLPLCFSFLLLLSACGEDLPETQVDVERYELMLLELGQQLPDQPKDTTAACVNNFDKVVGDELFAMAQTIYPEADSTMLARQPQAQTAFKQDMCGISRDTLYQNLFDTIRKHYPAEYDFASRFEQPFARLKKNFPELALPRIRTIALGVDARVNWQMQYHHNRVRWFKDAKLLTISLEYFLGPKTKYLHPMMPKYVRAHCTPEQLQPVALHAIIQELHKPLQQHETPRLIDYMLNAGIRYEALQQLDPELPPHVIMRYSPEKYEWSKANEAAIYNHLLPKLYESNPLKYDAYINEAPFTKAFGKASPPRLAEFIGWQIVKAYVENESPELKALVENRNYTRVFKQSNYKP